MLIRNSQTQSRYDTILIGGGLSGLLIANTLEKNGQSTLLVDPNPEGTASTRHLGVEMIPNGPAAETVLRFLETSTDQALHWREDNTPPVTFEAGFKPFVGFGEQNPDFSEEISFYTSSEKILFERALDEKLHFLTQQYRGHHLAGFKPSSIHIEGHQVTGLSINDGRRIHCNSLVFCDLPEKLTEWIPQESFQKKTLRALAKSNLWTSISLDLFHKEAVGDNFAMHVLMGTKDKTEPCWGTFFPASDDGTQRSQWMSLLPCEKTGDSEYLATVLKKIQKQLKRAYPNMNDSVAKEKIHVHFASHGRVELPLSGNQTLPEFENLWVGSQWVHPQRNLLGLLNQACLTLTAMGFAIDSDLGETSSGLAAAPEV